MYLSLFGELSYQCAFTYFRILRERASAMEELQAEMKLLNWHKLANEAALKAALLRTKSLRDTETKVGVQSGNSGSPANNLQEKAAWMAQVIEEEQRKPLQVSKDFVTAYAASEERASERLDMEIERHIEVLRKLRVRVGERDELKYVLLETILTSN